MDSARLTALRLRVAARWPDKFTWNWKCALMSGLVRSGVYAVAMARGSRDGLTVIAIEMLYVAFTAGLYAGLQQKALRLRRRWVGDLCIVVGVPGLSQWLDWLLHQAAGAPAPHRAVIGACVFTLLSALFHRHVMRHGTFLTGTEGRTMAEDFRRIPRLVLSFILWPAAYLRALPGRLEGLFGVARSEGAEEVA